MTFAFVTMIREREKSLKTHSQVEYMFDFILRSFNQNNPIKSLPWLIYLQLIETGSLISAFRLRRFESRT